MKKGLVHPLWVHIPAVMVILVLVIALLFALPLSNRAPVHFDINGQPDAYGSPLLVVVLMLLLVLFFIIVSGLIDELWARQEKKKSFNWLSLLDDFVAGAIGGTTFAYIEMLVNQDYVFRFPWFELGLFCGLAIALAIVLEILRPYRRYESVIVMEDNAGIRADIEDIVRYDQPLVYWESQNPLYSSILTIILLLVFIIAAIIVSFTMIWMAVLYVILAFLSLTLYGGFRTIITGEHLVLKLGLIGIPLLKLNMSQIVMAETYSFSPLKDFGGYGIRFNGEMKAFYLSGNLGVKITAANGKKYLIGSKHPDHMNTVINYLINKI